MIKQLILVFVGGGFGSALRLLVSKFLNNFQSEIPYGTFVSNILGSLLVGIVLGYAHKNHTLSENYTLLLATGFCGGFTTFSALAYENYIFLKSGNFSLFILYTIVSIVIGLISVFGGIYLIKIL